MGWGDCSLTCRVRADRKSRWQTTLHWGFWGHVQHVVFKRFKGPQLTVTVTAPPQQETWTRETGSCCSFALRRTKCALRTPGSVACPAGGASSRVTAALRASGTGKRSEQPEGWLSSVRSGFRVGAVRVENDWHPAARVCSGQTDSADSLAALWKWWEVSFICFFVVWWSDSDGLLK